MTNSIISYITSFVTILTVTAFCQDIDKLHEEANKLYNEGNPDSAEVKLKIVVDADNTYHESHYLLSQIYLNRYDLENSRKHLTKAIEADKTNQTYREEFERINKVASDFAMAKRKFDNGDFYGAIDEFRTLSEKYINFAPKALYFMGVAANREEEISEAAGYLQHALELDPNYQEANNYLNKLASKKYNEANQLVRRGDYEEAKEMYKSVLELSPNYYQGYFQLGFVATKQGDFSEAIRYYIKTVELQPYFSKGWFALALAYQKIDEIALALDALSSATDVDPTYAKAYAQKGNIYLSEGDFDGAEQEYNNSIQADPSYAIAYQNLGKVLIANQEYEDAIQTLSKATDLDARSFRSWTMLAQAYNSIDRCYNAKDAAHEALEIKKNYAPALFDLGLAEKCLDNETLALQAFNKARRDRNWRKLAEREIDKINNPEDYE
jgi:tetratricopeptide (TPR) repeat protein|tara:strand:- start:292 stop:1608 length:1317 start_codon:yes stop_codon:yes gene_type:complete